MTLFFLDGESTRTLRLIVIYSHPAPGFIKIGLAHSRMGGVIWERGVRLSSLGIIYRIWMQWYIINIYLGPW